MEMMLWVKLAKPAQTGNQEFFTAWLHESQAVMGAVSAGAIKNVWKVAGKYEIIAVFEVESGDQMDQMVHSLPIWQEGYAHIVTEMQWIPLRPYKNWAADLENLSKG